MSQIHPVRRTPTVEGHSGYVLGRPAYRNRLGRSGLDPMDTYCEQGYMLGWLLRALITDRFRTRNLFYLVSMFVVGIFFLLPLLIYLVCLPYERDEAIFCLGNVISLLPWALVGIGLFLNVILSFLETKPSAGQSREKDEASESDWLG